MIPFIAGASMRVYVAIFGRQAAYYHLHRILRAMMAAEQVQEGVARPNDDDDSEDDDDEDDLLPEWGRIARRAWRKYDER